MHSEMTRFVKDLFSGKNGSRARGSSGSWKPAVDMYETDNTFTLKVDLPGFSKADVEVEIKDNLLTLKGERKRAADVREGQYHRVERAYGAFQRSFMLPRTADAHTAEASFKNGVLEIKLAKAVKAKSTTIDITT
jgi:HSP20 family protein